jgi:hypothetical protein
VHNLNSPPFVQVVFGGSFPVSLYGIYNAIYPDVVEGTAEHTARQLYTESGVYDQYVKFIECVVQGSGGNSYDVVSRILRETAQFSLNPMNDGFNRATGKTYDDWKKTCSSSLETTSAVILQESGSKLYLHVYDNQGRHVGLSENTGLIEINIPGASYFDFGKSIVIGLPGNIQNFRYSVDAANAQQSTEDYTITVMHKQETLVSKTVNGSISKGDVRTSAVGLQPDHIDISEVSGGTNSVYYESIPIVIAAVIVAFVLLRRRSSRGPRIMEATKAPTIVRFRLQIS